MEREVSSSSSVLFDKLQLAMDTFILDQEKRTGKLRAEVEAMFVQHHQNFAVQRLSDESFKISRILSEDEATREDEISQKTYMFDSLNRALPIVDDEDSFDPDAIDLFASESSSSSDVGMTTPCLAGTGTQQRDIQNRCVITQPREWDWDKFVKQRTLKCDLLKHFIHHQTFVFTMTFLIILNSGYIGVVAHNNMMTVMHQYDALEKKVRFDVKTPEWDVDLDFVFMIIFTVEIVLRVLGDEFAFFFGEDWKWNWMDLVLVASLDVAYVMPGESSQVRVLRLLRVIRTIRSLRLLSHFRVFTKFRLLALAIQHSIVPLTWACILLFGLLYVASMLFLNGASEYLMSGASDPEVVGVLYSYFGGLDRTILTLFMCISGGVSWEVAVGALMQVHVAYGVLFVAFIAGMMLAALNIIAGIFVNDAIEMAQQDREVIRQAEVLKKQEMETELRELFMESDQDNSGTLTVQEFSLAFEHPEVEARFRQLGVELKDTTTIFQMLDIKEHDVLDIGEFVSMVGRAKMLTQPLDLQSFLQQNKQIEQGVRRNMLRINEDLDKLAAKVDTLLMESAQQSSALRRRTQGAASSTSASVGHTSRMGTAFLTRAASKSWFR
mmetsp:Transcript_17331/g.47052  ORF Transcript_17331/g.47052 Transcript_17331/m.47052 type:complete len:609 (-) Transcript_17331:59-1885(-)